LEGSVGNCESGLCCRSESQPKKDGTPVEPAGRWGRQGCDLPYRTLVNMFEFIRDN
jgi:hypothetical protein